ncbi:MAG: pantoate--beta-alanine ligase, partial [Ostreibacterium sp.]
FGEKDFQQLVIIRRLVEELFMQIDIVGGKIIREEGGLAMSSRNQYLSQQEQQRAKGLSAALRWCKTQLLANEPVDEVLSTACQQLNSQQIEVEYLDLRDSETLQEHSKIADAVLLIAAKVGKTRLIDNVRMKD